MSHYASGHMPTGGKLFTCECGKRSRPSEWTNWETRVCGYCTEVGAITNTASDDGIPMEGFSFKTSITETPKKLNARFWKYVASVS